MNKTRRQDLIVQLLRGRDESNALSIQDLLVRLRQEDLNIHQRTVRRDVEELSLTYGLLSTEDFPEKYYLAKDFNFKYQVNFTEKHLEVLVIALNHLKHTTHLYFDKYSTEIEQMIFSALPDQMAKSLLETKKHFDYDFSLAGKSAPSDLKDFELIFKAIREQKIIKCKNHSPYREKKYNERVRVFAPLLFVLSSGVPYLMCEDREDKEIKRLRVSRLEDVEVTNEHFDPPVEDLKEKLKFSVGGWGSIDDEPTPIEITCKGFMALHFGEKTVHESQKLKKLKGDKYLLSFNCLASFELVRLLASFGDCILDIKPDFLKDEVEMIWNKGLKKAS